MDVPPDANDTRLRNEMKSPVTPVTAGLSTHHTCLPLVYQGIQEWEYAADDAADPKLTWQVADELTVTRHGQTGVVNMRRATTTQTLAVAKVLVQAFDLEGELYVVQTVLFACHTTPGYPTRHPDGQAPDWDALRCEVEEYTKLKHADIGKYVPQYKGNADGQDVEVYSEHRGI